MIKIAFIVTDMTFLRHFLPLIEVIQSLNIETKIYFLIDSVQAQSKYCSITKNKIILEKIVTEKNIICLESASNENFDVVFTVEEVCANFKDVLKSAKKNYSLQYFFDYRSRKENSLFTKIACDEFFVEDIKKYSDKILVSPVPPTLYKLDELVKYGLSKVGDVSHSHRHVTVFYPETGGENLVTQIVEDLYNEGYKIHIKQRRKNQAIPKTLDKIASLHYDDEWYPSESYYLPTISDFCVGFGTSAYCDLTSVGINFLDIALTSYSRTYLKPHNLHVYLSDANLDLNNTHIDLEEIKKIKNWISEKSLKLTYKPLEINSCEVKNFVSKLLEV